MTSRDFCFWLQGYFEIEENKEEETINEVTLTPKQLKMIRSHLNLVFKHEIDPSNLEGKTEKEKAEYSSIHKGGKVGDVFKITEDLKEIRDINEHKIELNC